MHPGFVQIFFAARGAFSFRLEAIGGKGEWVVVQSGVQGVPIAAAGIEINGSGLGREEIDGFSIHKIKIEKTKAGPEIPPAVALFPIAVNGLMEEKRRGIDGTNREEVVVDKPKVVRVPRPNDAPVNPVERCAMRVTAAPRGGEVVFRQADVGYLVPVAKRFDGAGGGAVGGVIGD